MALTWRWHALSEMSAAHWHTVASLRQAVFVVEQTCAYADLDALDTISQHLLGHNAAGELVAYLRLVPPGVKYPDASLGRILVAAPYRRQGLGRELVQSGLRQHQALYPGSVNTIGAQTYLLDFYRSLGFVPQGEPYLEDNIPHIDMRCCPAI